MFISKVASRIVAQIQLELTLSFVFVKKKKLSFSGKKKN